MKLYKDEKELSKSIENEEWRSVNNLEKEMERARTIARATGTKNERMNIRMNRRDMMALKTRALERGVPYQTLVSSILRRWLRGESVIGKRLIHFNSLFDEHELRRLAPILKKYLAHREKKGVLMVSTGGAFQRQPSANASLLDQFSSGDFAALSRIELTAQDAAAILERLNRIRGRQELSETDRQLLEKALQQLTEVVATSRAII
ncbi:MAG: hypothetical protein ABSF77_20750 [Spirochaetia bacterium]|jgi:predicted DNA binding CopG/RHH family protein